MQRSKHLFFLMNHVLVGFLATAVFGAVTGFFSLVVDGEAVFSDYMRAYFVDFNGVLSGSLILSTSILVFKTQEMIPELIESTFEKHALDQTEYNENRRRFFAAGRSASFATTFAVTAFGIFYLAEFPLDGLSQYIMIGFACAQYALGVYVGRKLFYIAQMLNSIENLEIGEETYSGDKLGIIPVYVNSVSTLTVVFVFAHVNIYYGAPFEYSSIFGDSIQTMLLLPAIIATPVVAIFNFYPRSVLRILYARAIEEKRRSIMENLLDSHVSEFERMIYLIEYDRISGEELQNRVRASLSDLPIGITIVIMVVGLVI